MLPSILRSQGRTFSVARPLLAKKSKETILAKEPKKKPVINEGAKKNKVKIDEKLTKVKSTHALIEEIETRKKISSKTEEITHFSQLNPKAMVVVDLKRELKLRGLSVKGLKADLTTRLNDALKVEASNEQTHPKAKLKTEKVTKKLEEVSVVKELEQKDKVKQEEALKMAEIEANLKAEKEAKIIADLLLAKKLEEKKR